MTQQLATAAIKRVTILHHPMVERSRSIAEEISKWLQEQNIAVSLALTWDDDETVPDVSLSDLVIVLGGDGSMLRAGRLTAEHDNLLLGINLGKVGFLTEMGPGTWQQKLPQVLANDFWIEERLMLTARAFRDGVLQAEHLALNDAVVSRGSLSRVIRLATDIDREPLTTYVADGLIIATPTGSTAYALAAGGPILPPQLRNILVIPIAAHLTLNRPIVLAEGATVGIKVKTDHQAILTVDGQYEFELQSGDYITVNTYEKSSRFIRLGKQSYFYDSLLSRLEPKLDARASE